MPEMTPTTRLPQNSVDPSLKRIYILTLLYGA
jgi:hypothetical protein